MQESFSEWLHPACVPEAERVSLMRELMSYAMLCPHSSSFGPNDELTWSSAQHWSRRYEWPWVLHQANTNKSAAVLDIGGCWSVVEYVMANRCAALHCLENDMEALAKAGKSAAKLGFHNIWHTYGDARELPWSDCTFNVVTCISVLEHVPSDHAKCISEMLRVLKPGGTALITMDVKLSGERENNSFINLGNVYMLPLPTPRNHIAMQSSLPGDDGKPLTFTVLLSRLVKPSLKNPNSCKESSLLAWGEHLLSERNTS